MAADTKWRQAIRARFPPRDIVARHDVFDHVWAPLEVPRAEVEGVLALLELEYGLEPGFFRPEDALAWLLQPVDAQGFWSRATNSVRAGDRQRELGAYLERRCEVHGIHMPRDLETLLQLVRACAGGAAT